MELSMNRLGLLIRRNVILTGNKMVSVPFILVLVALLIACAGLFNGQMSLHSYIVNSCIFLFVGGLIITSISFTELDKPDTGLQYMALPVSSLEKFLSGWFLSYVLYSVLGLIAFFIGYGVLNIIDLTEARLVGEMVSFKEVIGALEVYFFLNSLFLLGAATFKKGSFMKTVGTSILLFLSALLVYVLFAYFLVVRGMDLAQYGNMSFGMNSFNKEHTIIIYREMFGHLILLGIALFFMVVGYFKIKEREL